MGSAPLTGDPAVSVVMITRGRCVEALAAVRRLVELPERPPVIVVDNASADDTVARLREEFPQITVVPLDRNVGAAGRNVGVQLSSTPYVAFCDDDSGWEPGALRRAAELLRAHPTLALIAARILVGPTRELDPVCQEMAMSPLPSSGELPGRPVLGFVACGAIVRRDAFCEVGGFDERYGVGGEEQPLAIALAARGWDLTYIDDLTAIHFPSPVRNHAQRRRTVTRNHLWVAWRYRPWRAALPITMGALRRSVRDPAVGRGILDAIVGAPAVLRQRESVPAWLERRLRMLS